MSAVVVPLSTPREIQIELRPADQRWHLREAMHARYPDEFWRMNGTLVRLDTMTGEVRPVDVREFHALVPEAAVMSKPCKGKDMQGFREVMDIPKRVVDDVYYHPEFAPELEGVVHCPWMADDGRLVATPGYDEDSRTYLFWSGPPVDPDVVSADEVRSVLARLTDFEYAHPVDRAHALAAYIHAVRGPALWGSSSPLYMFAALAHTSGKSYHSSLVAGLMSGQPEPGQTYLPAGATERNYTLNAILAASPPVAWFDNVETGSQFGGGDLQAILTAKGKVSSRKVGSSSMTAGNPTRTAWLATANQPEIDHETARRCLQVRLRRRRKGRPFLEGDLPGWLWANRALVVSVLLRLVADWHRAGRPAPPRSLASFERWSELVGGPVCLALPGVADDWLAEEHRPGPSVDYELAELFDVYWPKNESGERERLRASQVYALAEQCEMYHVLGLAEGTANARGRVTAFGRALQRLAVSEIPIRGWRLAHRSRAYVPVEIGPAGGPRGKGPDEPGEVQPVHEATGSRSAKEQEGPIYVRPLRPMRQGEGSSIDEDPDLGHPGTHDERDPRARETGRTSRRGRTSPGPTPDSNVRPFVVGRRCRNSGRSSCAIVAIPQDDPGFPHIYTLAHAGVRVQPDVWGERASAAAKALHDDWRRADEAGDHTAATAARDRLQALQGYRDAIWTMARQDPDQRVRCRWELQGPGRFGTVQPPIQQVTKAHGLRGAFVPADGCRFVVGDWSTAHLWIAAGMAGDEGLVADLLGGDPYAAAGDGWPGDLDDATRRKLGKLVALASINGAGAGKLAELGARFGSRVTPSDAVTLRDGWLRRYPALRSYLLDAGRQQAWFSPLGREVVLPPERHYAAAAQGWRWQAAESDALRLVLEYGEERARAVLTNHDEIVWEVPESEVDEVRSLAGWWMDRALGRVAQIDALMSRDIVDGEIYSPASAVVDVRRSWAKEDVCE